MAARRNPEHPPYALMIGEAIQVLDEEPGSTLESISQHIKAHYDRLPPGHDRLLPYYMNKLIARGEFSRRSNGRYLLAHDEEEEVVFEDRRKNPAPAARKKVEDCANIKEKEVLEPLQSIPPLEEPMKAHGLDDEGVPMDCEGDLVREVRALGQNPDVGLIGPSRAVGCLVGPEAAAVEEDGLESAPRKKRSRLVKKKDTVVETESPVANKGKNLDMGPVVALLAVGYSVGLEHAAMEKDGVESTQTKRQGRPPLQVVKAQQEPMLVQSGTGPEPVTQKRSERQPKGRHESHEGNGCPSLLGPNENVEKPMGSEEACEDEKDGSKSVAKKPGKRATISKSKESCSQNADIKAIIVTQDVPKRRGRPPRTTPNDKKHSRN